MNHMAIGKRIKQLRKLRGMTQKEFGKALGFSQETADVRVAQYEKEDRIPKEELVKDMSRALRVSPGALRVPDIDSPEGILHTLFALEDLYGIQVIPDNGEIQLRIPAQRKNELKEFTEEVRVWEEKFEQFQYGEISEEKYKDWQHNFNGLSKED